MDLECKCRLLRNYRLEDLGVGYFSKNKSIFCEKHKDQNGKNKKFTHYCKDCKIDLCEDCLEEKEKYKNDTGNIKEHEVHDLINLSNIKDELEQNYIIENGEGVENNLKNLIIKLLDRFDESPSYKGYKSLKNAKEFLANPCNTKLEEILKSIQLKKINSMKELKENKFSRINL